MSENQSTAFHKLNGKIQRWIWEQNWHELRDAQEKAVAPILSGNQDIIITASTASGKTEAAFLPMLSRLLDDDMRGAVILYVSPLKALINDQFRRMESLCADIDIRVHPWHGDTSATIKKKFLNDPAGVILITPESLEALFVNHGHTIHSVFSKLAYVVVDELHSFIGTDRGIQLLSLLNRLETAIRRRVPRIGLSATIGDLEVAGEFFRPGHAADVLKIVSKEGSQEIKLIIKGYYKTDSTQPSDDDGSYFHDIGRSLFKTLRGTDNLVFCNSRATVEVISAELRTICADNRAPNEFYPHHGSLSKEIREDAESAIKDVSKPVSIICTSTLEMGIDIGAVELIAQIGPPASVASLRQRLGRSGRRGNPAILRMYNIEQELHSSTHPVDSLRPHLLQSIAMVKLLLEKWYEPPNIECNHYSTLIHQVLSIIAERGGITATKAYDTLCKTGPFRKIDSASFASILRQMATSELIAQTPDGILIHDRIGEWIVNNYKFYAVFTTPEEYRLMHGDKTLGTLPIFRPLREGNIMIFAGRRWLIKSVNTERKIIELLPSHGGTPPPFGGDTGMIDDRIRIEMKKLLLSLSPPAFLDATALEQFNQATESFLKYGLENRTIFQHDNNTLLFVWRGDRILNTIEALFTMRGIKVDNLGIALEINDLKPAQVFEQIRQIVTAPPQKPQQIAASCLNKKLQKFDNYVPDSLLDSEYATIKYDIPAAFGVLNNVL